MSKTKISDRIDVLSSQAESQVDFMETRVILLDSEKDDIDKAIKTIDSSVQTEIDDVNSKIKAVSDAYKAKITAGCTTLKTWVTSTTGIGTSAIFSMTCVELSPVGLSNTTNILNQDYTITSYDPGSTPGFNVKNMYGIKYYDEPHTTDVLDPLVGSFIGTVGIGSTIVTIMAIKGSGVKEKMKSGNLIVPSVTTFAGITSIVGFSTALANLSKVGIGSTGDIELVDTIIVDRVAISSITAPMPDGTYVEFKVLKNSNQIDVTGIPMTDNPIVPQTIGIMNSSNLGLGTYVKYDNSGNNNITQSWNPFLDGLVISKSKITAPVVGAGYTYYYVGYGYTPALYNASGNTFIRYPDVGETFSYTIFTVTNTFKYDSCPSCTTEQNNLTNVSNILSTKEASISAGIGTLNQRLAVANALRVERNRYTMQIWGARQTLSELQKEAANLAAAKEALSDPSVAGILT